MEKEKEGLSRALAEPLEGSLEGMIDSITSEGTSPLETDPEWVSPLEAQRGAGSSHRYRAHSNLDLLMAV